jgi:hypothetical protein
VVVPHLLASARLTCLVWVEHAPAL